MSDALRAPQDVPPFDHARAEAAVRELLVAAERLLVEGGQAITLCANPLMGTRSRVRGG